MRHVMCYEGVDQFDREHLKPGCIEFPDGKVPVVWDFEFAKVESILGHAEDFRREEDGSITVEIPELDARIDPIWDTVGATFWGDQVVSKNEGRIKFVSHCRVKAVVITLHVPWRLTPKDD